jgi:hypothetical protein
VLGAAIDMTAELHQGTTFNGGINGDVRSVAMFDQWRCSISGDVQSVAMFDQCQCSINVNVRSMSLLSAAKVAS